jgi:hypothetical protein
MVARMQARMRIDRNILPPLSRQAERFAARGRYPAPVVRITFGNL